MPRKTMDLQFPSGVGRRLGHRATTKARGGYPSPWAMNVRLQDTLTRRLRGGSFEGTFSSLYTRYVTTPNRDLLTTPDGRRLLTDGRPPKIYRDRAISFTDQVVTASRTGDHADVSLSADVSDAHRPVLLQGAEGGDTGHDVVAVVSHKDSHLVFFSSSETWVLSGNPATGSIRRVSDRVGIIAEYAFCVAHDTVYFLSEDGLYSMNADGSELRALSEDVIPEDLLNVDDDDCVLTYEHDSRGVHIHKTTAPSWFYDTERQQFWPFDMTTSDSHVLIGPLKLGGQDMLGLIQTMHGIVAQGSSDVTWRIVPGDTAEEAAANGKLAITAALAGNDYSSYVRESGTWKAGRSLTARPRVTAMYACIWLSSAGDWAYEGVTLGVEPAGRWRI